MRSPPDDLAQQDVGNALAEGWRLRAASMEYLPEGGGSHHWVLTDGDGVRHFVTVDDLDGKDWLGDTRQGVLGGLQRALGTAAELRHGAGLGFVAAPVPARAASSCAVLAAGTPSRSSRSWPATRTRSAPTRTSGSAGRRWT